MRMYAGARYGGQTPHPLSWKLAAAALVFALTFAGLRLFGGDGAPAAREAGEIGASTLVPASPTEKRIAALEAELEADPTDAEGFAGLGLAQIQLYRESGDPSAYERAEGAFGEALAIEPGNFTATSGMGALALSRHEFSEGLRLGLEAKRINPTISSNYGVIADAQIELGRYGAAARTLERWVELRPGLSSYARISYFRELHGDLRGALEAMRLAVAAGRDSAESLAYVETLSGNLLFGRGDYAAAGDAYRGVLERNRDYVPALAGLARVEASGGELGRAIRHYRRAVELLPLPEYAIALAEAELAAGRHAAAERDLALVDVQARLLREAGVNTDLDLAIFEADHGDPGRAVALAGRAWRDAPSVRAADAYAWALYRAGRIEPAAEYAREAMRLGSRDPSFLFHAGVIARAAGDRSRARSLLETLIQQSPRFHPLYAPRARQALQ